MKTFPLFMCVSSLIFAGVSSLVQLSMKTLPLHKMDPEKQLRKRGFTTILGSDESGNGCIAGPIVVATCGLLRDDVEPIEGVNDSKLLSHDEIQRIYDIVASNEAVYAWNIVLASQEQIDKDNVPTATKHAMRKSIENLVLDYNLDVDKTYAIVDGHKTPKLTIALKCRPWVKGDAQVYTVALASILAKHTHNNLVKEMHNMYPQYGFNQNRGYPTRDHIVAIHTHGPSPLHRLTAKPVKGREK
jgi:ribonuclease HII